MEKKRMKDKENVEKKNNNNIDKKYTDPYRRIMSKRRQILIEALCQKGGRSL
jgi:hypothetical protein